MGDLIFHDVEVDRTTPARETATRLREFGFVVTGDYDEEHRLLNREATDWPPAMKVALALVPERRPEDRNTFGTCLGFILERGLRFATFRETAALAAARPELFAEKNDAPVVVMDPLKIEGDDETWVPVFAADATKALRVEPIGDDWTPVRVPVVQL